MYCAKMHFLHPRGIRLNFCILIVKKTACSPVENQNDLELVFIFFLC